MCNEKINPPEENRDYRFIDYRLTQVENNLKQGQQKLEKEQNKNYKELVHMLQLMQEANNEQNSKIIEVIQRQKNVEEKLKCVEKLREIATRNTTRIHEIERRIEVYKQILFVIGTGVAVALIKAFVFNI